LLAVLAGALAVAAGLLRAPLPAREAPSDVPRVDGRAIVLTPKFRERLGLKTTVVRSVSLTPVVKVAGTVTFDPKFVSAVGARLKGLVRKVYAFEGDRVKRGAILAEIDSAELGSAQASVLALRAQSRAAGLNAKREKDLASRGLTTAREVEESTADQEDYRSRLIAAEQQVSALGGAPVEADYAGIIGIHQLRSPLAGTVVERNVSAGQSVEGHLTVFRVADLDHLWVELAVFERSLGGIRKGDKVDLQPLASPRDALVGQIAHIGEQVDLATRTAAVRVEVDNSARKLRPGQAVTARVHVSGDSAVAVKVVPVSAITYVDGKATVFVAETDLRLITTPVELGESDGTDQEILAGVSAGQVVVTDGVFALKSELFR
jgi:cobalt-zinc-cadmium efflux system membrane fusion protein